jgi:hypothetical protein
MEQLSASAYPAYDYSIISNYRAAELADKI